MFSGVKIANAILTPESVNVNPSIITETLSINDLLESIECLTRYIISQKRKNYMSKLLEQINNKKKNRIKLSKVADIVPGFSFKSSDFVENGTPLVKITEIQSPYVVLDKCSFVDISKYSRDKLSKFYLKSGEYVVAMTGATVGKVGKVISNADILLNQRVAVVRSRGGLSKEFINMQVSSPSFEAYIKRIASGSSAQANISGTDIGDFEFDIPDLPTQKKIASILGAYDEKIENNNKIIKNLEETAQTIFNEWFVNFKFPGYEKVKMVDSEMGEIPEGWEVKDLNDIANITFGFNFKSKLFNENGIGVPVVRIRDVLSGITQTFSPEIPSAEYEIKSGDLLIGMDGIFHCAFWYNDGYFLNQRVVCIRSDFPGYFIYESIRDQLDFLQKTIIGATVGHLSNGDIRSFKILIPKDKSLLKVFKDITNKILSLKKENISLKSQRDLLLSKLI